MKLRLYIPLWIPRFWKLEFGGVEIMIQKELPLIIVAVILLAITIIVSLS